MGINVEWIINKAKEKIYAVSHAKAVIRGNHTIDEDLTNLENTVKNHTHDERYYTESEVDTRLDDKIDKSLRGIAGGIAELDDTGRIPSAQLPSYVDDVIEYNSISEFPTIGEGGKIYIEKSTNQTYRWSGSDYVSISQSITLGETSSTAYAGDKGKNLATNLSSHVNNTDIHVTNEEKASWNSKAELTDIPTTLPANGGNADTVDNKHASDFSQMRGDIADCDEAIAFGTYNILPETKNAPTANYYHLVVEPAANGVWIKQTSVLSDATAPLINSFTRININGEWSEWTSSCVNADTVDGFHANEIASSPNLIVNPNFKVNQKGLTSFSSNGYTVDHWRMYKHSSTSTYGTVSVIDNGIHVVSGGTKLDTHLQQYIENWKYLEGKTVTLSFEIDNLVGSLSVCQMGNTPFNITTNGVHTRTFNWESGQSNNSILFYNGYVAQISYDLKWVKLELGSIATPFVPPDFATELLRIQAMDGTISADTVDGKHASDFSQIINLENTPTDTKTAIGIQYKTTTYWCSKWTDYPAGLYDGQGMIIAVNYKGSGTAGTNNIWCKQIYISPHANAKIYQRTISGTTVEEWTNIADGGNATTANTASTLATTSSNICLRNLSSGTAAATWDTATSTGNCPVGAWYGKHS